MSAPSPDTVTKDIVGSIIALCEELMSKGFTMEQSRSMIIGVLANWPAHQKNKK